MTNNILIGAGTLIILFSLFIFGGLIGVLFGVMLLIWGSFATSPGEYGASKTNYSLIGFGVVVIVVSLFIIGGSIGVLFGLAAILAGVYLPSIM